MATMLSGGDDILRRLILAAIAGAALGCSMDPKQCFQLRDSSYQLINQPNYCRDDAECKASEWPGCSKPINQASFDKIHASMLSSKKGKCQEQALKCDPPPPVFCQEGLCTFRYKPFQGPMPNLDQIQIE